MSQDFKYWKKQHDSGELNEFNTSKEGLLWLKIKSIGRKKDGIFDDFIQENEIVLETSGITKQMVELFDSLKDTADSAHEKLDKYFIEKNESLLSDLDEETLSQELYKVDRFQWGADNNNDLSKYLVKLYIKDNNSYDYLISKMNTEIVGTVQDYLVCSWYNHWSSILIEHLFKSHELVLPTVGQIKSVDFFIDGMPFDLKVTYLPTFFIETKRGEAGKTKKEISELKAVARKLDIKFDLNDSNLYYQLTERLRDNGSELAVQTLDGIKQFKLDLIEEIKSDPSELCKGLYEKQSDFRFGAENRIFLILIDKDRYDESWKLKRNMTLLKPGIHEYLDGYKEKTLDDLKVKFYKEGNPAKFPHEYEVLTDAIIVEK